MDCKKVGQLIKALRKEHHLTQKQIAEQLHLSDRTISKWERGVGCPDVSLLGALSSILKVDLAKLLSGELSENDIVGGNMKNTKYYVCPVCGSITACTGNASISCCGRPLEALEPKKAAPEDRLDCQEMDGEWHIETTHPATKENYISFIAFATGDSLQILKQYPEWEIHAHLPKQRHGKLLWYSTTKGFFYQLL